MNTTHESVLTLSEGGHEPGDGKACIMEYVALLAGEAWSDNPMCTHPVLASMAREANDRMNDENRHLLVPLIGRLFGTSATGSDIERRTLSVNLAIHSAKSVLHLVSNTYRAKAVAAIEAAERWVKEPSEANSNKAYKAYSTANSSAINTSVGTSIYASAYAISSASHAAAAAGATNVAETTAYAVDTTRSNGAATAAAHNVTTENDQTFVDSLASLIDEYDRLTGRTEHREVKSEELDNINKRLLSFTP